MTSEINKNTAPTSDSRNGKTLHWLQRHLRKEPSMRGLGSSGGDGSSCITDKRPQTAPSCDTALTAQDIPHVPPIPPALKRQPPKPPGRPPRPDSGVIRDVHAWLEASTTTPSPPLMGGISYWKRGINPDTRNATSIQHAIPIVEEPSILRPSTSHGQQGKLLRPQPKQRPPRPAGIHKKSYRAMMSRKVNMRSKSVPNLATPDDDLHKAEPLPMPRTGFTQLPSSHRTTPKLVIEQGDVQNIPESERERNSWQRWNGFRAHVSRSAECTRPSTACPPLSREDSASNLSDAPTYSSGLPVPSSDSRAASILSTSSFGCIDGMNPEYRQLSQRRAAQQRSMKAKLKRFAQSLTT